MKYAYDIHFEKSIQTPEGRQVLDKFITLEIDKSAYDRWIVRAADTVYFDEILDSQFKDNLKLTATELLRMMNTNEMNGYRLKYMIRNYKRESEINK